MRIARGAEAQMLLGLLVGVAVFGALNPDFLTTASLSNVATGAAFVGIIALGETVLLLGGEFDLSVGSVAGLASVLSAQLMLEHGGSVAVGLAVALGVGLAAGLVNAFCVLQLRLPSFITTIGTSFIAAGLAVSYTRGNPVYPLPDGLVQFGLATPLGLSWLLLIFLVLGLLMDCGVRYTSAGRRLMATGGDAAAAAIAGIRVRLVKTGAFVACSVLAASAGFLQMAAQSTAQPTTGSGAELAAVAAAVIGGTSIFGGSGSVLGTVLGVLFLTVVTTGLVSAGLGQNWQPFATGTIMIAAIAADVARRRRTRLART